jgi:hypothetical protein
LASTSEDKRSSGPSLEYRSPSDVPVLSETSPFAEPVLFGDHNRLLEPVTGRLLRILLQSFLA